MKAIPNCGAIDSGATRGGQDEWLILISQFLKLKNVEQCEERELLEALQMEQRESM